MTKATDSSTSEKQDEESAVGEFSQPKTTDEKVDSLLGSMMGMKDSFDKFFSYIKENSPQKKSKKGRKPESPEPSDSSSSDEEKDEPDGDEQKDGSTDEEANLIKRKKKHSRGKIQNRKINFKLDIRDYDGSIDVEKLDDWIDRLETYFTLYDYSSEDKLAYATLKLSKHALTW
ncbi:hypothetical protein ACHQM5_004858 [Ranunculus cassubicifolius]